MGRAHDAVSVATTISYQLHRESVQAHVVAVSAPKGDAA